MKTVLFVCVHNAGRSQMAEAFTNHFAEARGLSVCALSAGMAGGASLLQPRQRDDLSLLAFGWGGAR